MPVILECLFALLLVLLLELPVLFRTPLLFWVMVIPPKRVVPVELKLAELRFPDAVVPLLPVAVGTTLVFPGVDPVVEDAPAECRTIDVVEDATTPAAGDELTPSADVELLPSVDVSLIPGPVAVVVAADVPVKCRMIDVVEDVTTPPVAGALG